MATLENEIKNTEKTYRFRSSLWTIL